MIRVLLFDREPVLRAGVETVLRAEPDLLHLGGATHRNELWPLLHAAEPDVVVVGGAGTVEATAACLRILNRFADARVVIYARDAGPHAVVAATLAGAHGLVEKEADPDALVTAIRAAARGMRAMPPLTAFLQRRAAAQLAPRDRAILAMRLAGTPATDIASTLGMPLAQLEASSLEIIGRLGNPAAPRADSADACEWPYRISAGLLNSTRRTETAG